MAMTSRDVPTAAGSRSRGRGQAPGPGGGRVRLLVEQETRAGTVRMDPPPPSAPSDMPISSPIGMAMISIRQLLFDIPPPGNLYDDSCLRRAAADTL